jgi:hypothetical protein
MAQPDSGAVVGAGAGNQINGCYKVFLKNGDTVTEYGRNNSDPGLEGFIAVAALAATKGWTVFVGNELPALPCGALGAQGWTTQQP